MKTPWMHVHLRHEPDATELCLRCGHPIVRGLGSEPGTHRCANCELEAQLFDRDARFEPQKLTADG